MSGFLSAKVTFVLVTALLISSLRYPTMMSIALSSGTDGYKLTSSYSTWISVGYTVNVFVLLINSTEILILRFLSFGVRALF